MDPFPRVVSAFVQGEFFVDLSVRYVRRCSIYFCMALVFAVSATVSDFVATSIADAASHSVITHRPGSLKWISSEASLGLCSIASSETVSTAIGITVTLSHNPSNTFSKSGITQCDYFGENNNVAVVLASYSSSTPVNIAQLEKEFSGPYSGSKCYSFAGLGVPAFYLTFPRGNIIAMYGLVGRKHFFSAGAEKSVLKESSKNFSPSIFVALARLAERL